MADLKFQRDEVDDETGYLYGIYSHYNPSFTIFIATQTTTTLVLG